MSDYTPSTRRVRATYIHGAIGTTNHDSKAELLREQFDRWLESFGKTEQLKERERIIKLLKAEFGAWSEAVALIEGENK